MLIRLSMLLVLVLPFVIADVEFVAPAPGASEQAGSTITATWQDSKHAPALTSLAGYTILLMVGGDTDATSVGFQTLDNLAARLTKMFPVATSPDITAGPPDKNAYFLKITSAPTSGGGTVVNYSQRFSVSGMTGAWPSLAIQAAFKATSGALTAVPATVNTVTNGVPNAPAAGGGVADGQYGVSYQFQTTGLTKYAPMQLRPGNTITATNTAPLFPPSLFTVAPTYLPTPSIVTTITQSVTFSVTSIVNPASPAPMPSDDMQKFLARWRD
ncbi:hypothetical protein MMC26_006328 [Xylographa opegraphella]|nr:hypothetical protein [Xylographa opegraphella]